MNEETGGYRTSLTHFRHGVLLPHLTFCLMGRNCFLTDLDKMLWFKATTLKKNIFFYGLTRQFCFLWCYLGTGMTEGSNIAHQVVQWVLAAGWELTQRFWQEAQFSSPQPLRVVAWASLVAGFLEGASPAGKAEAADLVRLSIKGSLTVLPFQPLKSKQTKGPASFHREGK